MSRRIRCWVLKKLGTRRRAAITLTDRDARDLLPLVAVRVCQQQARPARVHEQRFPSRAWGDESDLEQGCTQKGRKEFWHSCAITLIRLCKSELEWYFRMPFRSGVSQPSWTPPWTRPTRPEAQIGSPAAARHTAHLGRFMLTCTTTPILSLEQFLSIGARQDAALHCSDTIRAHQSAGVSGVGQSSATAQIRRTASLGEGTVRYHRTSCMPPYIACMYFSRRCKLAPTVRCSRSNPKR